MKAQKHAFFYVFYLFSAVLVLHVLLYFLPNYIRGKGSNRCSGIGSQIESEFVTICTYFDDLLAISSANSVDSLLTLHLHPHDITQ